MIDEAGKKSMAISQTTNRWTLSVRQKNQIRSVNLEQTEITRNISTKAN